MSEPQPAPPPVSQQIARLFEQPPDAPIFYADFAQVLGTGNEVILQFYESTPGPPGASGAIETVRSRLRATAILSPAHCRSIGQLLLDQASAGEGEQNQPAPPDQAPTEG
jgi:hypothetical protein